MQNLLEPDENSVEESIEETGNRYGMTTDYDFVTESNLRDGAVAATAKVPGVNINEVEDFEDYADADRLFVDDEGQLYSAQMEEQIGFIGDEEVYSELEEDMLEHVNLHENHHLLQYQKGPWGDKLAEQYDLSDSMIQQLNEVNQLMNMAEDPLYQHLVNEAEVTALVEGYTERITQAMQENGEELGEAFYPGYTQLADHMMKNVYGTDPEEEFSN